MGNLPFSEEGNQGERKRDRRGNLSGKGGRDVIKITFGPTCLNGEGRYTENLKQQIHTKSFFFQFQSLSQIIYKINDLSNTSQNFV